jgi:hypothetical protein
MCHNDRMMRPFVLALALAVASPAAADVTITMTTGGKGMGLSAKSAGTTYIKGNRLRTDLQVGDKIQTTIFDLDTQKMYSFESKKKEADVFDMAAFSADVAKSVDVSGMKATITPNGKTKPFGSLTGTGYDLEVVVPFAFGGNKEQMMTVTMTGPIWVVKNAPGTADYVRFYRTAAERGWIFGDPRAAKAQPGNARAQSEMYRKFAELGGVVYEMDVQMKMGGGGMLGGVMARMGNVSMQTLVESAEAGTLADDLFAPPAGYKLNTRK